MFISWAWWFTPLIIHSFGRLPWEGHPRLHSAFKDSLSCMGIACLMCTQKSLALRIMTIKYFKSFINSQFLYCICYFCNRLIQERGSGKQLNTCVSTATELKACAQGHSSPQMQWPRQPSFPAVNVLSLEPCVGICTWGVGLYSSPTPIRSWPRH